MGKVLRASEPSLNVHGCKDRTSDLSVVPAEVCRKLTQRKHCLTEPDLFSAFIC